MEANAAASMAMPMSTEMAVPTSRAITAPMRHRQMHAAKRARKLVEMAGVKEEGKEEARGAGTDVAKAVANAGQTATRVNMTPCKRVLPPTRW